MPSSVLSLRLFGTLEARIDAVALSGLHLREGARLLAYLTLHHNAEVPYRQLAQLFWPSEARFNDDLDRGDYHNTRMAIHSLRRALGDHAWRLASVGKSVVRFDLDGADVDIREFERLVQQDDHGLWRQAAALYRSPLLEGWVENWVMEARARYQRSFDRIAPAVSERSTSVTPPTQPGIQRPMAPQPKPHSSPALQAGVEADGGAVPLGSPYYIERDTDAAFGQAIARRDSIVLVKGARQIGKTSLLARGLQRARQAGNRVLLTDFHSLSEATLSSADTLYRALAQEMADQLDLNADPEATWNTRRSPSRNLERFLCDAALGDRNATLVWGMDEVDRLFSCSFGTEIFGLLRSWHNRRALDPDGPWSRLTLAMAYATEAHLFIQDHNQSPFNVGTRLALSDFTREQVAELNMRYGSPLPDAEAIERFYALLRGHPYLTRRGLAELSAGRLDLTMLETQADRSEGVFSDHLRRLLAALMQNEELTGIAREMMRGQPCPTEEAFYRLRSAGLVTGDTPEEYRWRCPIYIGYFARHLKI